MPAARAYRVVAQSREARHRMARVAWVCIFDGQWSRACSLLTLSLCSGLIVKHLLLLRQLKNSSDVALDILIETSGEEELTMLTEEVVCEIGRKLSQLFACGFEA